MLVGIFDSTVSVVFKNPLTHLLLGYNRMIFFHTDGHNLFYQISLGNFYPFFLFVYFTTTSNQMLLIYFSGECFHLLFDIEWF